MLFIFTSRNPTSEGKEELLRLEQSKLATRIYRNKFELFNREQYYLNVTWDFSVPCMELRLNHVPTIWLCLCDYVSSYYGNSMYYTKIIHSKELSFISQVRPLNTL